MTLSAEETAHVARLARLKLTEEELVLFAGQLGRVLDHVRELDKIDTSGVSPTAHIQGLTDRLRADEPATDPAREALMGNAPSRDESYFKVPKVIG